MKKMKQRQSPSILYFSHRELMCLMFTDRREISRKDLRPSTSFHSVALSLCSALTLPFISKSWVTGWRGGTHILCFHTKLFPWAFSSSVPQLQMPVWFVSLFPTWAGKRWITCDLHMSHLRETSGEGRGWNSPAQVTSCHPLSLRAVATYHSPLLFPKAL